VKSNFKLAVNQYIATFNLDLIFEKILVPKNQIFFIGGVCRSIILNNFNNYDIDLVVPKINDETIESLKDNFEIKLNHNYKNISFKLNDLEVQISSFRKDISNYGRHAKVELAETIDIDSARRDLTFNAIYINLLGEVTDFYSGEQDLLNSQLRFLGNPVEQIQEDYLRAIRYIRFLSLFNKPASIQIDIEAIKMLSKNIIDFVKPNKIKQEMLKIKKMEFPNNSLQFINQNKELVFLNDFLN
jgi:poly(A) polymerase